MVYLDIKQLLLLTLALIARSNRIHSAKTCIAKSTPFGANCAVQPIHREIRERIHPKIRGYLIGTFMGCD
jgi:hypothetical protein